MGSRYGSLKQVDPVGPSGETILEYSVYDAIRAGFGKVVFVIRRDIENDFKEIFINKLKKHIDIEYVFQELNMVPAGINVPAERVKPWGTGHAVMVAAPKVKEPFAVINADDSVCLRLAERASGRPGRVRVLWAALEPDGRLMSGGVLRRPGAESTRFQLLVPKPAEPRVAHWLRALSDAYVDMDPDDIYAKAGISIESATTK